MGTTAKSAIQKYKKAVQTAATKPDVDQEAIKKSVSAKGQVAQAIEAKEQALGKIDNEVALQKELEKELVADFAHTNKLVKGDFSPTNTNREKLIVEYSGLIKFIASKIAARLPSNIELDDLISSGVIGLMDAIDKYDSSRDNKFKTYAEFRIRGAILDELRSQDWVPRSVREKAKVLERAYAKIEQVKGRQATDDEVCVELGMSTEQYHEMLNEVRSVSLLSYDDITNLSNADKRSLHGNGEAGSKVPTPYSEVSVAHLKSLVTEAIEDLPEKQRLVLSLYYYEDLNLKEIGRVLDVTESRVSQLHSQAILKLKARLRNHWDDFLSMVTA
jgi:RNA polymerase sigma factor for flagellar operon FliA